MVFSWGDLPRCSIEDVFCVKPGLPDEDRAAISEYLSQFVKPDRDGKCYKCEQRLMGFIGTFTWGLAHGEGFCSQCKTPGRAYHVIKDPRDASQSIVTFQLVLQYHPRVV
jgi:hypothetical protein